VRRDWRRIGANLRLILIAVFGAVGTMARYGLQGFVQMRTSGTFPYGTLLINLTGTIGVGFFGGYTTFSSFGWETAKMLEDGEWLPATTYVAASIVAGLLLTMTGIRLANKF
jgi:CrcB protein